jgi:sulfite exporter TauE/SafE
MVFEHFQNSLDFEDSINNFFNLFIMCSYVMVGCIIGTISQILGIVRLLTSTKPSKSIWPIAMGEVILIGE